MEISARDVQNPASFRNRASAGSKRRDPIIQGHVLAPGSDKTVPKMANSQTQVWKYGLPKASPDPGSDMPVGAKRYAFARGSSRWIVVQKCKKWPEAVYDETTESHEHVKFRKGARRRDSAEKKRDFWRPQEAPRQI